MNRAGLALVCLTLCLLVGVASRAQGVGPSIFGVSSTLVEAAVGHYASESAGAVAGSMDFTLLIYNIAGLPVAFSPGRPDRAAPHIGPLLNDYELVLVQEDFAYHRTVARGTTHPYHSTPRGGRRFFGLGDGLNRFSRFPFGEVERIPWSTCSGVVGRMYDCIAVKGYTVATTWLATGVPVDIYNVHLDAGSGERDQAARTTQIGELIDSVQARSDGRAVIIAGDTNMRPSRRASDAANLDRILAELDLTDACAELHCVDERVDRILYRSGVGLSMRAVEYRIPAEFVDDDGAPLSDHRPVAVHFLLDPSPRGVAGR